MSLATTGVVLASCDDTPSFSAKPEARAACLGGCVADPASHCVVTDACSDSRDCRSGTACLASADASGEKRCQVPDQSLKPVDTLVTGFTAARLRLTPLKTEGSTAVAFEWEIPDGTTLVSCALFSCLPEVAGDGSRLEIINFDQCAVAWDVFVVDPDKPIGFPFSLAEDVGNHYQPESNPAECQGKKLAHAPRRVTHLAVGCWAYNTFGLTHASKLLYVDPSSVGDYGEIPQSAACTVDASECYDSSNRFFGTCLEGKCRARCLTDTNCFSEAEQDPTTGGAGGQRSADGDVSAGGADARRASQPHCEILNKPFGVCVSPEAAP